MSSLKQLKRKWLADPAFAQAYESLKPEFAVAHQLIAARNRAGLSQTAVARKMRTTQSAVARLEGGTRLPALSSLERYARAVGHRVELRLVQRGR
jgi:predicted transcriptional regulator